MVEALPASLTDSNKAAVAAAKAGDHEAALKLYEQLFLQLKERHLSHPQQFITHSNKAASHLALGQHAAALQEAQRCMELLTASAAASGLQSPSRHPHWPKACLRMGQAFLGLGQHTQAASAFEAGLGAEPLNPALKAGLQQAQQGLATDMLSGKTLAHIKALPAPVNPERITLTPHNSQGLRVRMSDGGLNPTSSNQTQRRGHAVGWKGAGDAAAALLDAAAAVGQAVADSSAAGSGLSSSVYAGTAGVYSHSSGSSQLPRQLLTPAAAEADVGLRDVYEYLATQCDIKAPKQYMYRVLPDEYRMSAWWAATAAAVQAVQASGRSPRVLLLGARAGVLAAAALRAGAAHVTCVESCPYLAAACQQVLQNNGFPAASFSVINTRSPSNLKLGPNRATDVPNICNVLVADLLDDGVLSWGLIPCVSNALEELLVTDQPVIIPQRLTVMAQAVGVKPSVVGVRVGGECNGCGSNGSSSSSSSSGSCGSSDDCGSNQGCQHVTKLDLSAMDAYRWTSSQALPSPLDPTSFIPLSKPKPVWDMPLTDVVADRSAVQRMDLELTAAGSWAAVAFWAQLQLFEDIHYTTQGPWDNHTHADAPANSCQGSPIAGRNGSSSTLGSNDAAGLARGSRTAIGGIDSPSIGGSSPSWDSSSSDSMSNSNDSSDRPAAVTSTPPTAPAQVLMLTNTPWTATATATSLVNQGSGTVSSTVTSTDSNTVTSTVSSTVSSSVSSPPNATSPASSKASGVDSTPEDSGRSAGRLEGLGHLSLNPRPSGDSGMPCSHQPAVCWLPGGLMVKPGEVYPLVASHNTVRCLFTIPEADYSFLFRREPSFPHSHFAMVADTQRLQAYADALSKAVRRAAATQPQQQQQQQQHAGVCGASGVSSAASPNLEQGLTVVDLGCGSGMLSMLAAAVLRAKGQRADSDRDGSAAVAAVAPAALSGLDSAAASEDPTAAAVPTASGCPEADPTFASAPAATGACAATALSGSVVGIELVAPLAAVAQRAAAANGLAGVVSVVQADAGSCKRGQQVPLRGADIIMLDAFDAGVVGHGVLALVEVAKSTLAAEGAQVLPATATLYCMGVQVLTVDTWGPAAAQGNKHADQQQQQQQQLCGQAASAGVNLQALEQYKWSDQPDTVLLHYIPHKPLTRPAKLADFDFCAPAGTPYPKEMQAALDVTATGQMNGLVVWFDLHLAEGVPISSAPRGFTTGGRVCDSTQQHQHHWGQALHYLAAVAAVQPGDEVILGGIRDGPQLSFGLLDAVRSADSSSCNSAHSETCPADQHEQQQEQQQRVALCPAPRPPWLRPGAGIEDPAVWSVKKCQQLLGQMLQRAPGAKFLPIYKDLELMQVHAGSLGLDAATVGAVTQELTMQEALAVASQRQLAVSPFAMPEAAGLQPPLVWR